jgi:hypothetical protein
MKIERTKLFGQSIPENRSSVIERPVSDFKTRWIVGACESDDRARTSGGGTLNGKKFTKISRLISMKALKGDRDDFVVYSLRKLEPVK